MGPQVQPKCFRHVQHMRNNWELRKRGYLIRFGHTEALLLKKYMTLNGHFSRPAETDPYASLSSLSLWQVCSMIASLHWIYSYSLCLHEGCLMRQDRKPKTKRNMRVCTVSPPPPPPYVASVCPGSDQLIVADTTSCLPSPSSSACLQPALSASGQCVIFLKVPKPSLEIQEIHTSSWSQHTLIVCASSWPSPACLQFALINYSVVSAISFWVKAHL